MMITPPFHYAIVAGPIGQDLEFHPEHILYRGAFPAARNETFIARLALRTIVCLRPKPLKEDSPIRQWAEKQGINIIWFKADAMGEEKLGMSRSDVGDILKIILDFAAYPIYLADVDGISHTTLIVACLRKLQGWHPDSIINEIYRFEPDHDELPLVPFITSYLSSAAPSKDDPALQLPPPPYPSWLWPNLELGFNAANNGTPPNTLSAAASSSLTRATPQQISTRAERAQSNAAAGTNTTVPSIPTGTLPFPNPLTVRRHPSMRLAFPAAPPPSAATATSTAGGPGQGSAAAQRSNLPRPPSSSGLARVADKTPIVPRDDSLPNSGATTSSPTTSAGSSSVVVPSTSIIPPTPAAVQSSPPLDLQTQSTGHSHSHTPASSPPKTSTPAQAHGSGASGPSRITHKVSFNENDSVVGKATDSNSVHPLTPSRWTAEPRSVNDEPRSDDDSIAEGTDGKANGNGMLGRTAKEMGCDDRTDDGSRGMEADDEDDDEDEEEEGDDEDDDDDEDDEDDEEDDDDDADDYESDEEDEDDDQEVQATSQYISALDLAGFS